MKRRVKVLDSLSKLPVLVPPMMRKNCFLGYLLISVFVLGIMITVINFYQIQCLKTVSNNNDEGKEKSNFVSPKAWILGSLDINGSTSHLNHIFNVLSEIGFTFGNRNTNWLIMWSHEYPFTAFEKDFQNLKQHQRVNHFPGSGFITNKVNLAQTNSSFIPKAFALPGQKKEFLELAEKNKSIVWVQKSNDHRGIRIQNYKDLDLTQKETFVQEYISNPLLIDGRKFDIGIYTIVTAINPLRVYYIEGDALFRFCPLEYHPFNSSVLGKYVVDDEYLPLWQMPSFKYILSTLGLTFKNSFNHLLSQTGKDPTILWTQMYSAIKEIILMKEPLLIQMLTKYPSKRNFFEMMRFDFVVDANFKIYLMEANMSPNLSSDHFKDNARLYEHVLLNLFSLVGIRHLPPITPDLLKSNYSVHVSPQDILVFPRFCLQYFCGSSCQPAICKLCKQCLSEELSVDLKMAYLEHIHRGTARRIFPPSILQSEAIAWSPESKVPPLNDLNLNNQLMYMWFIGKCQQDLSWCH